MKKLILCLSLLLLQPVFGADDGAWKQLRENIFQNRAITSDSPLVSLEVPDRANDGAFVPVIVRSSTTPDQGSAWINKLYLIVDDNPSPLAGVFTFHPQAGRAELETRIRVESYTWVRVIGESQDGRLFMVQRYLKASGGCSAPAGKDAAEALKGLGEMRLKTFAAPGTTSLTGLQLMVRHPNFTGLAMDQLTRLYTPAYYVHKIDIFSDGKPLFQAEINFSISENPNFRLLFQPQGIHQITAKATDTKGREFGADFALTMTRADATKP